MTGRRCVQGAETGVFSAGIWRFFLPLDDRGMEMRFPPGKAHLPVKQPLADVRSGRSPPFVAAVAAIKGAERCVQLPPTAPPHFRSGPSKLSFICVSGIEMIRLLLFLSLSSNSYLFRPVFTKIADGYMNEQ